MKHKLGRKPRAFNTAIKSLKQIYGRELPTPPTSIDWSHGITDFGVMLNDKLGDCTCAAVYHARQIWTANVLKESTESDSCVLKLYEEAAGYNPNDSTTDQGAIEQDILQYLLNTGIPLTDGTRDKIVAYAEVDSKIINEVKLVISEFGLAYIGFEVPANLFNMFTGTPRSIWNILPFRGRIVGGHAVILVGYDAIGPTCVSWGKKYKMTWAFYLRYVDEVYAIIDNSWINTSGKTPLNLSIDDLEDMTKLLK